LSTIIEGLQPQPLWQHFLELTRIPRCSKSEEKVGDHVLGVAKRNNLEAEKDSFGNVVVRKPASHGMENAPIVILQGHMDMVCEKNKEMVHNFDKDPIQLVRDGDYIKANGTTLGSDNGIGLAAALAIMEDKSITHGPLEFLFTVDEETGLTGASNLSADFLKGRILLNLDAEEEGSVYVGCAGGRDSILTIPLEFEAPPKNYSQLVIRIKGLRGGHSGVDIHTGRANAIKLLNRVLWKLSGEFGIRLARMEGGSKRNAIPREAEALVYVAKKRLQELREAIGELDALLRAEVESVEKTFALAGEEVKGARKGKVIKKSIQKKILNLIYALPHGVIKVSADIPGLVETSTNVATVSTMKKAFVIGTSQRSSVDTEKQDIVDQVEAVALLAGAKVERTDGYPGWKPNMSSHVLKVAKMTYQSLFSKEPEIKAIHAGLECGIIGEKFAGMDMTSFGPTIENPHSPDERVNIPSVKVFWGYLLAVLNQLAKS
jgi:dipeptidase D